MKNTIKRLVAVVLLLCLVLVYCTPATVEATTNRSGDRYNIMLVIDGSGSLASKNAGYTDPYNMRYELIGELMGILEEDGHSIGAVVFSGTASRSADPTDAEMEECLMLNTGMLDLDEPAPDGRNVKDYLEAKIIGEGVDNTRGHGTDIGTALMVAQKQLQKKQAENGQESVIFLFTDGNTGFTGGSAGVLEKSEKNRDNATLQMSQNGIRLFAAFLNNGGKLDDSEMKRLVCAANGINTSSPEFSYSYIEVRNASNISTATTNFLKFLGYIPVGSDDGVDILSDFHDSFTIPGLGVEEINIRLYTPDGADLPDMDVQITNPSGNAAENVAVRNSRTYRVYKIVDPEPGVWNINGTVPVGNSIKFRYTPILSLHIDSVVESQPGVADICVNTIPEFNCLLAQSGVVVKDPNAYIGYDCKLEIMNSTTGEIIGTYPVQINSNGELKYSVPMNTYGYFEARAIFTCDDIVVKSTPLKMDLTNRTPSGSPVPTQQLKYGLFQPKSAELDLTAYFSDPEDGSNLRYTINITTCNADAFNLSGGLLTMSSSDIGDGEIHIDAVDSQGASVSSIIYVETTNVTIFYFIAMIILLLVIAILAIASIKKKNNNRPDGTLSISFDMPHGGRAVRVELDLAIPGVDTTSKTNLYKLLQDALRNENRQIMSGLYARDVTSFLMNYSADLSSIAVSAEVKKKSNRTVGAIGVKHGKRSTILYDSFADYFLNDTSFTLEFKGVEEEEDMFGDSGFPTASSKKQDNPFDDDYDDVFQSSQPQHPSHHSQNSSSKEQGKSDSDDFDFF